MPRKYKYSLKFKKVDASEDIYENMTINELIDKIKDLFMAHYNIEISISHSIIFNMCSRDNASVNKLLRSKVEVQKYK